MTYENYMKLKFQNPNKFFFQNAAVLIHLPIFLLLL